MLVDSVYTADKELTSYFKLFENQEDPQEIIDLLSDEKFQKQFIEE